MILQNLEVYLDNVDTLIKDEDKLVTYKWLSKELEVHVNIAKEILRTYWESHKNDIDATFVIKGELPDGSLRLEVTRASNLENAKEKFSRLDFEHIYSVQKTLPDLDLLANAGDGDVKFSAIKLSYNALRNELPKHVGSSAISEKTKENESKVVNFSRKEEKEKQNEKDIEKEKQKKKDDEKKKDVEKKKNNGKMKGTEKEKKKDTEKEKKKDAEKEKDQKKNDMSPEEKKGSAKSKTSDSNGKGKTAKKPVQSTKTGFNHLFGKVASQPKPPPKVEKPPVPEEKKEEETKVDEISSEEDSPPEKKVTQKVVKSTEKTSKPAPAKAKPKSQSQSKKTKTKKNSVDAKKRKRIIAQLDDSSDEDVEVYKSDYSEPEEIIEEEKPKKRKSPSPVPVGPGKMKIRKIVNITTTAEDGFFRTEQVVVFEEVEVEPEPQQKPEPKIVEPLKNKQTKLTNFFKRS